MKIWYHVLTLSITILLPNPYNLLFILHSNRCYKVVVGLWLSAASSSAVHGMASVTDSIDNDIPANYLHPLLINACNLSDCIRWTLYQICILTWYSTDLTSCWNQVCIQIWYRVFLAIVWYSLYRYIIGCVESEGSTLSVLVQLYHIAGNIGGELELPNLGLTLFWLQ